MQVDSADSSFFTLSSPVYRIVVWNREGANRLWSTKLSKRKIVNEWTSILPREMSDVKMMLCMMKKKMNGETGGKSRPPTKTGVRLESRGGRGPAMMETQFGTKPAYAARELVLGWCWWVLVGIARGEGPGSCSGCAGRRGSRGWSLSSERSDPRKGAPQTVFAIRTPALARSDAMDCYRSARGCVVLGGKPLFS